MKISYSPLKIIQELKYLIFRIILPVFTVPSRQLDVSCVRQLYKMTHTLWFEQNFRITTIHYL